MNKITFEENDLIGEKTLEVIGEAEKFNKWMYTTIKPYCNPKVLEIGSGIGNISNYFLQDGIDIMLTDIRKGYCSRLKSNFSAHPNFLGAEIMDLTDDEFDTKFEKHLAQYDTVFALNVIEHIYDDSRAIMNCKKLLREDGNLIILVPSYQSLFCRFDEELGHYRRYTKSTLSKVFEANDLDVFHQQYFNFVGLFGWFINGKILKSDSISQNQMRLFNRLVPILRFIDRIVFNSMGLSTIIVGRIKGYPNEDNFTE